MKRLLHLGPLAAALAAFPLATLAGVIGPELAAEIANHAATDRLPVIIEFSDRIDPAPYAPRDRTQRSNALMLALKAKADQVQRRFRPQLEQSGAANVRQIWLINALAASVPVAAIEGLARQPSVGRIDYDAPVTLGTTTIGGTSYAGWNLMAIHAADLWTRGFSGAGITVATMDTGVDLLHPDLAGTWRGGTNSWFDPYGQHATPADVNGHGTQTMGLLVGGTSSGAVIGVAPHAHWIAARIYNDAGQGTLSNIHLAFQWLFDPDGNPATVDAPDVVNASWGLSSPPGSCNTEFSADIATLKAAGIGVVFAAGNSGPAADTSLSPANNPGAFSAGAVDDTLALSDQSSRGPSACDAGIFPKVVAPGVNVVTTDLSAGGLPVYATVSGTSFAAPHVAGTMALLAGAFPSASIPDLEGALTRSAQDLGATGADNDFGYGLNDALAAYNLLAANAATQQPPAITSTPVTSALEGQLYAYQVTASDPEGGTLSFALDTAPAGMAIDASGRATWTPAHAQVGSNAVAVRVTDPTGLSATQSFSVTVAGINHAPVASSDSYSVVAGTTLAVASPGVLANDTDADGNPLTAVLASGVAHGTLTLNANGSFQYVPAAGYAGADSFSYAANDGTTTGNAAVVAITVVASNKPPVAANDSFTAPARTGGSYKAQVLNVLANDSDPDGTLNAASVTIAAPPDHGGSVTVSTSGTVSYTPKQKYKGTETFKYQVKDNKGAVSNVATVTITVL